MATITSTGAGSGLNVSSLVTQLVAAERAPYDKQIATADAKLTTEFSALSKLKAAMSSFQSALGAMKDADAFAQRKVTVGDEDVLAATATKAAAVGTYEVEVRSLAKAAQLATNPYLAGATAPVGSGTLQLSMGAASFNVTIDPSKNTLADIRDAINSAAGNPGVRATLIKATDGTRLVLTGSATGAANGITVTANGGDGGLAALTYDPQGSSGLNSVTAAADAVVMVSGYEVHSAGNTVSDAIDGVTLSLKQADVGNVVSISVANDDGAVATKAQGFVSAYNVLANQIAALRSYNAETKAAGPLLGDAMLRGIETQVRRMLSDPVSGGTGRYTSLATLGITTTATGTLALDSAKFNAALSADPTAAAGVFSGTSGVATKLEKLMTDHLGTTGDVSSRDAGITARRKQLTQRQEALDARMEVIEARYKKQFNTLDSLLTQLQSTSTYLANQLGSSS